MPTYWCNFPSLFAKIVKILTTTKNYLVAKISVKPEQQSQNASFFCMAPPHNWRLQTLILVWQNSTLDVRCLRKIRTRYATLSTFAQLLLRARRTDSRFTERMNVDLQNIVQLELKIVKFPISICMIVSWTFQMQSLISHLTEVPILSGRIFLSLTHKTKDHSLSSSNHSILPN